MTPSLKDAHAVKARQYIEFAESMSRIAFADAELTIAERAFLLKQAETARLRAHQLTEETP